MAALDRRVPSLDDFVGQSWTAWADWAGMTPADGPDVDDCNKNGKKAAEAMSLSKEDMSIFGLYPGHDDFYLVVCSHCGQVVKPQAFENHCERRHGPVAKLYARLRSPTPAPQPQQRSHHGPSPPHGTNAASWEGRNQGVGQLRAAPPSPVTPPQYRYSKTSKDGVRLSCYSMAVCAAGAQLQLCKAALQLRPSCAAPVVLRELVLSHCGSRGFCVSSERKCDLDKHCGVLDPDRKKVCTRLLTCNIHSIHQRRKVVGRSKNFDQLVAELKTRVREKGSQALEGGSSTGQSLSPEAPREQAGTPHCRRPLVTLPAFRFWPTAVVESAPEEESQRAEEGNPRVPSPLVHGRISSDESEAEGNDERAEFPSSAAHPRPAAVRRPYWGTLCLHVTAALTRRHRGAPWVVWFNTLLICSFLPLCRKIPQAADLQSPPPSAKTITAVSATIMSSSSSHSKVRTGSHISSSLKTASSSSSSSRGPGRPPTSTQLENYGSNSSSIMVGSHGAPAAARYASPGRPKNPVGRPSKQMLKLREQVATAAVLRKRKVPSQEGEHSGPDRNCIVLQDRGRPPSNTSSLSSKAHAQTNGTLSPSSKPHPQRTHPPLGDPSPTTNSHSRVGDSGLHGQGSGRVFEHQMVKKRKAGRTEDSAPSSKPSAHCLTSSSSSSSATSSPRSNFYPWKDNKSGTLSGGVEKKLGTQKCHR
uniref:Ataxin 7-like 2a n=1 Tax=Neolamprologus brichardi TaxID=32507 RepID=A0A3Q4N6F2_NEOBR